LTSNGIRFGIVVATYRRKDGKTPMLLKRCIDSVTAQTCHDYQLFIIGDKYENDSEIQSVIPENAIYENIPYAYERDNYTGHRLWCCGGGYATRYALRKFIAEGYKYLIVLDHDEWWANDHLQSFYENTPFAWACTKALHINGKCLPRKETRKEVVDFLPEPKNVIKSAVCWNFSLLPLMSRNVYEATGKDIAGDKDLWVRMSNYIQAHNLRSIFINKLTCFRDGEGYARTES